MTKKVTIINADDNNPELNAFFGGDEFYDEDTLVVVESNFDEFNAGEVATESLAFSQGSAVTRFDRAGRGVSVKIRAFGTSVNTIELFAFNQRENAELSTNGQLKHIISIEDVSNTHWAGEAMQIEGTLVSMRLGATAVDGSREIDITWETTQPDFRLVSI